MIYFTVGPSQLHPRAREFIERALAADIPSLLHRGKEFGVLFSEVRANLQKVFGVPEDYQVFFGGSATEFMERSLQNISREATLHFVGGAFSKRFCDMALALHRRVERVNQEKDGSFPEGTTPNTFQPELVCLTHNETSNGTEIPGEFFESVRARYPDSLIAVDVVSSAPCFPEAFKSADCLFFSIQKGFGLPAGLGVALVSPRAMLKARDVARTGVYTGSYHSFEKLAEKAAKGQTPETPNVLGIYLLNAVCADFLRIGTETMRKDSHTKAELLYNAIARSEELELPDTALPYRSSTTIVARAPKGSRSIIERLRSEGYVIQGGYDEDKETHVRIGNYPAHSIEHIRKLVSALH